MLDGYQNEYAEVAFLCKICKKSLPADRKNSWKAHYKTHSDTKEFVCNVCGKGFHTRFNMERHMKTHFKNNPTLKTEIAPTATSSVSSTQPVCQGFDRDDGLNNFSGLVKDEIIFD